MSSSIRNIFLYSILLLLLVLVFSIGLSAIVLLALIVPLLAFLKYKFSIILPLVICILFSAACFLVNWDLIVVFVSSSLLIGFIGLIVALKRKSYVVGIIIVCLSMLISTIVPFICVSLVKKKTVDYCVSDYIVNATNNTVVIAAAKYEYESFFKKNKDQPRVEKSDEKYTQSVLDFYAEQVRQSVAQNLLKYLITYSMSVGAAIYLIGIALNRSCKFTIFVKEKISDFRLPKGYFVAAFVPAAFFSIFGLIKSFSPITAAAFSALVIMPSAIAGVTLLIYSAMLFKGKFKILSFLILISLMSVILIFPLGMYITAALGFADYIINTRKLLEYALK